MARRLLLAAAVVGTLAGCSGAARSVSTRSAGATATTTTTAGVTVSPTSVPIGGSTGSATIPPRTTTPPTVRTPTTPVRPRSGAPVLMTITSADDRSRVTLRVGDSIKLLLDDSQVKWTDVTEAPAGLLAPDPSPTPPPHGQLLIWTALHPGTVQVTAVGTAWCPDGVACPMWARLFGVTLVIA